MVASRRPRLTPARALPAAHGPPPVPTEALVRAAREGHHRAFHELVRRFRPRIRALALHLTANHSDADDVAQDVFLRAWEQLSQFEGRSAFFTWIYRIAVNRALQVRERAATRPTVDPNDPRVTLAVAADGPSDPRHTVELRERYGQLLWAFDQLSPLLRTTVALTTLQGLSHPEAAAVLGCPEGTVAWRMHEARARLRDALARCNASPLDEVETPRRRRSERSERDPNALSLAWALAAAFQS
jgi:RNA polymerase sigma-70 factor, ECF subfamily